VGKFLLPCQVRDICLISDLGAQQPQSLFCGRDQGRQKVGFAFCEPHFCLCDSGQASWVPRMVLVFLPQVGFRLVMSRCAMYEKALWGF
jgi:hypothetical protein